MRVVNGTADVTTYFVLRDSTNHAPKADVTITDIDLYYVEELAAISAKADATALAAADSAHSDSKAFHIGQGLYRVDWPDTCFNGGVGKKCILIVVCSGVDTTFLEVELTGTEQTGDSYAIVNHTDYGNAKLVRSTTPANTLTVDANHLVAVPATQKVDVDTIKTQAVTCGAGVTILAQVGAAGAPGAANGLVTTNGTKVNQTVDLTAGQSIACSDKTGFSLAATGADLILKSSTFIQAIVAAVNEFATYGLTALNTLLVTTGIKTASLADNAITAASIASDAITAAKVHSDVGAEIADAVWDEASTGHTDAGKAGQQLWTDVDAILADTNELQVDDTPTAVAAVKTVVDAVKVQTDKLAFTVANQVDANIQYINDTQVAGNGGVTPWGPV